VDNYETIGSLIYEAKIRAKQTDRETEAQRQRILADAQADAQRIREEAQAEAQKTLDDVQRQVDEKMQEGKLQYNAVQEELSRIVAIFSKVQKQFMNSYRDIQKIVNENPGESAEMLYAFENAEPENLEIYE
jgi:cell division septum initiation protein DivIVA